MVLGVRRRVLHQAEDAEDCMATNSRRAAARLVAALNSDRFDTRDAAERELQRLGRTAGPALRKALKGSPSAEQRRRVERLLEALNAPQAQDVAASRAVEVLEW